MSATTVNATTDHPGCQPAGPQPPTARRAPPAGGPRLVTRLLLLRFVSAIGSAASFYLLLSVVPLYAKSAGAGQGAAGLTTTALTLAAVAGEMIAPRLMARCGYRAVLAAGLVLLGGPALVLAASRSMTSIVAACLARGLGFGLTVVAGGALTASLIPAERRGEGLALLGVVVGVPSVIALPAGAWLADHIGYPLVFSVAAIAPLAALASVPGLRDREPAERPVPRHAHQPCPGRRGPGSAGGIFAGMRSPALARPAIVFSATTMAAGIIVTFLPLAAASATANVAALALLIQPAVSTLARWQAGRYGDRHGPAMLILPGLVASAAGMLVLMLTATPAALIAGAVLFGAGFGVTQNATLTLMYARVPQSGYGTVSALWNLAYDAGMGLGAAGFGVAAGHVGYPAAFAITSALMLTAIVPARRDWRADRAPGLRPLRQDDSPRKPRRWRVVSSGASSGRK